jgi:hypothetical protein
MFGWQCWHSYTSNPSSVVLMGASDRTAFFEIGRFTCEMESGEQVFPVEFDSSLKFLKIVVEDTFGAEKTYMN